MVVKGLSTGAKALIGVERLAILSAKLTKFANALTQGILSVVKVGKKPKVIILLSPGNNFGKLKLAYKYYNDLGWPKGRIKSHLDGIDFSKPVELVEIPKGKSLSQFQAPGGNKGNYFAEPSANATELGINPKAQLPNNSIVDKTKIIYETTDKAVELWMKKQQRARKCIQRREI